MIFLVLLNFLLHSGLCIYLFSVFIYPRYQEKEFIEYISENRLYLKCILFFHFFMFTFSNSTKAGNLILQNCLIEQRRQFCQVKLKETLREFPDVSPRVTEETVTTCPSYVTLDAPVAISLERDVMLVTTWESTGV